MRWPHFLLLAVAVTEVAGARLVARNRTLLLDGVPHLVRGGKQHALLRGREGQCKVPFMRMPSMSLHAHAREVTHVS